MKRTTLLSVLLVVLLSVTIASAERVVFYEEDFETAPSETVVIYHNQVEFADGVMKTTSGPGADWNGIYLRDAFPVPGNGLIVKYDVKPMQVGNYSPSVVIRRANDNAIMAWIAVPSVLHGTSNNAYVEARLGGIQGKAWQGDGIILETDKWYVVEVLFYPDMFTFTVSDRETGKVLIEAPFITIDPTTSVRIGFMGIDPAGVVSYWDNILIYSE